MEEKFNDFLVEYDLTPEQLAFAQRLKAEANLKQLLNCLGDHALFYSRQAATKRRRPVVVYKSLTEAGFDAGRCASSSSSSGRQAARGKTKAAVAAKDDRPKVLQWFESLDVAQRVSVLTCQDTVWLRTALRMSRTKGSLQPNDCRFRVTMPKRTAASGTAPGKSAPAARAGGAVADPNVQCRRPHHLPDGSVLVAPATDSQRKAWSTLLEGLRLSFKGCCSPSQAFEWSSAMVSAALLSDCKGFVALMDEVSLGLFLAAPPKTTAGVPWAEASWLHQWGTHFPMAAFVASRLEVLLIQAFASRDQTPTRPPSLPLADVWSSMSEATRASCLRRLGRRLLRRILSETFATMFPGNSHGTEWKPPYGLAELFAEPFALPLLESGEVGSKAKAMHAELSRRSPLEVVGYASSVSLVSVLPAADDTARSVLLGAPRTWLHQQFGEELAILCCEHSANALLDDENEEAEAGLIAGQSSKRRDKKQRQKLRRRHAAEEEAERLRKLEMEALREQRRREAPGVVRTILDELIEDAVRTARDRRPQSPPQRVDAVATHGAVRVRSDSLSSTMSQAVHQDSIGVQVDTGDISSLQGNTLNTGGGLLDDSMDGGRSEHSSTCAFSTTTRSNSIVNGLTLGDLRGSAWGPSTLDRLLLEQMRLARQRSGRRKNSRGWHDDSRLEFLLRNRDRFSTEMEWDRMSQGSVPASLDEGALFPVGLETRFAHLFDSPRSHSHVTTSALASQLASQTTVEDDADRLQAQWEDFEEWRSLTQALEKSERELQMWKTRAQELETQHTRSSMDCSRSEGAMSADRTPTHGPQSAGPGPQLQLRRQSSVPSSDANSCALAWRYLALLVLARHQLFLQQEAQQLMMLRSSVPPLPGEPSASSHETAPEWDRSYSMPGLRVAHGAPVAEHFVGVSATSVAGVSSSVGATCPGTSVGCTAAQRQAERSPSPEERGDDLTLTPIRNGEKRRGPLHVSFDARRKRMVDGATQTAPAITLSKMYGGMVPRYIQRELAHLRQENQILRYRIASLAMSQPLGRPNSVRHQATQTAPAITFSTARQLGSTASVPGLGGIPRTPSRLDVSSASGRLRQVVPESTVWPAKDAINMLDDPLTSAYSTSSFAESPWLLPEHMHNSLEDSVRAFVRAVEAQTARQKPHRNAIQDRCRRVVQALWPRSSVELYGSFASGLALPSSGLDLVIYPNKKESSLHFQDGDAKGTRSVHFLSTIDEDVDVDHTRLPLDEVSPGQMSTVPSLSSNWQQQLSCRLAQERWVLNDSIRVTAHAAVPLLSMITTPEETPEFEGIVSPDVAREVGTEDEEEPLSFPVRVDISLDDPNHRGLRSKAFFNWLLGEFPFARPVTLVLKQWLIERTYGMSHTGGLCSYGLLLMVVGYLQRFPARSVASALAGCLDFYGRRFDPQQYGVSVARRSFPHRKTPMSWPPPQAEFIEHGFCPGAGEFSSLPRKLSVTGEEAHRFDPLWIEDPLMPTNNVGRNCFRIRQIQRSLARAADALTNTEAGYELRAILRVERHSGDTAHTTAGDTEHADGSSSRGLRRQRWDEVQRSHAVQARHALHEDLYSSLVEPDMMPPMPVRAQIARSHLPQQWDSAVRYAARPPYGRSRV